MTLLSHPILTDLGMGWANYCPWVRYSPPTLYRAHTILQKMEKLDKFKLLEVLVLLKWHCFLVFRNNSYMCISPADPILSKSKNRSQLTNVNLNSVLQISKLF